jgi:hypothetical protein
MEIFMLGYFSLGNVMDEMKRSLIYSLYLFALWRNPLIKTLKFGFKKEIL